ncbi:MAG TPA: HigA family addiction module antitoxin [Polyangiaceae bacterium]|nr:HigA family addiction module antitoxin [Polyangiaceae bacterium]
MSLLKFRPIHPGEILREQLEELGLSARALATKLGVPTNRITGILNETRSITPDTALRLAKFFGAAQDGAVFWLNLQQAHDLRVAELAAAKEGYLRKIATFAAGHGRGARRARAGTAA